MEILLLILLLLVFLLPSFLMMRRQRRNQAEIAAFQNSLQPGDRVVTVSGLHGAVVGIRETEIDLEIAPQVTVTLEKMSVVRGESQGMVGTTGYQNPPAGRTDQELDQPRPDTEGNPYGQRGTDPQDPTGENGHPENFR